MPNAWTIIRYAAMLGAGFVVERAVTTGWKVASGHTPPTDAEDFENRVGEVVAYALVSGALIALARVLAIRGAARMYTKYSSGPIAKA